MPKCILGFEDMSGRDGFFGGLVGMGYVVSRWQQGKNVCNGRIRSVDGSQVFYETNLNTVVLLYDDAQSSGKDTIEIFAREHRATVTEE